MKFHLFHDWGKWGPPFDSNLGSEKKGQARRCATCGKCQVSYVRSPWNWWFSARQIVESVEPKESTQ